VKHQTTVARVTETAAGAVRIISLAEELGLASMHSRHYRLLRTAIRIEARAYRKALDTEQATAMHGARVQPTVRSGSLTRRSVPIAVRRRDSGSRSDPRR
jgi:hypothetical protein